MYFFIKKKKKKNFLAVSESRGRERDGGKEVGVDDRGIHTAESLPWRRP